MAHSSGQVHIKVAPAAAWPDISPLWQGVAGASPHSSFFLTTDWIETWLESFCDLVRPSILVFESGRSAVGACLVVSTVYRRALFPIRRVSLNAAGEPAKDTTYVEFNDVLCRPGWEEPIARALVDHLLSLEWDELSLDGFCEGIALTAVQNALTDFAQDIRVKPSYYVDLVTLRRSQCPYENELGPKTRKHLRQNLRYYGERGPLRVEAAGNPAEALEMINRLADLHQKTWAERGREGTFASARFRGFHRALVSRSFQRGAIQLLEVLAGEETVGLLYNFVYRGKVYFYQSAYNYEDRRSSPGMVTLYHAVQHCLDAGLEEFDFLAGDDGYKKSLSTNSRRLVWAVFRKPKVKFKLIGCLSQLKHLAAQARSR
jgi:Acetyltransferase (GNAT) domain